MIKLSPWRNKEAFKNGLYFDGCWKLYFLIFKKSYRIEIAISNWMSAIDVRDNMIDSFITPMRKLHSQQEKHLTIL